MSEGFQSLCWHQFEKSPGIPTREDPSESRGRHWGDFNLHGADRPTGTVARHVEGNGRTKERPIGVFDPCFSRDSVRFVECGEAVGATITPMLNHARCKRPLGRRVGHGLGHRQVRHEASDPELPRP